jgi:hypothetical protein
MRQLIGVGTPRGLQGRLIAALASFIALLRRSVVVGRIMGHSCACRSDQRCGSRATRCDTDFHCRLVLTTGC